MNYRDFVSAKLGADSACGPTKYRSGEPTEYGEWHGEFDRVFLPMGEFKTNQRGNLEHIETGSEDFRKFELPNVGGKRP